MTEIKLSTERLNLRLIELSDLDSIHALHSLPEIDKYNTLGIPKNIQETKSIIEGWIVGNNKSESKNLIFAIEQTISKKFIGLIALKIGNKNFRKSWYD